MIEKLPRCVEHVRDFFYLGEQLVLRLLNRHVVFMIGSEMLGLLLSKRERVLVFFLDPVLGESFHLGIVLLLLLISLSRRITLCDRGNTDSLADQTHLVCWRVVLADTFSFGGKSQLAIIPLGTETILIGTILI